MDSEHELQRAKWLLGALFVFLVSGCFSWSEFTYLVFGNDATADISKTFETRRRGRFGIGSRSKLQVEFAFTEPGGVRRTGTDTVSRSWTVPANGKIAVRYTPGIEGNARVSGNVNWAVLVIFTLSLATIAFFGIRLLLEAREATSEKPKRRPRDYDD